jgi:hypothetical protein
MRWRKLDNAGARAPRPKRPRANHQQGIIGSITAINSPSALKKCPLFPARCRALSPSSQGERHKSGRNRELGIFGSMTGQNLAAELGSPGISLSALLFARCRSDGLMPPDATGLLVRDADSTVSSHRGI